MKKIVNIFCLIIFLIFCLSAFAMKDNAQKNITPNWEKLSNNIFIDKNSVSIDKHGYISAWFKIFASEHQSLSNVDGEPVFYEIIKYEVDCTDKSISIEHSKSYDKKNNMLREYINKQGYGCLMPCIVNDYMYYNALCKYNKDTE